MKMNRRGEIATLTVLAIAGVALLVGTLAPTLNPFNRLFGGGSPDASNQKATWTKQTETRQPIILLDKKGEAVAVGEKTELVYDTGAEEKPVKLTAGQKIGRFFANLTTGGLIFLIVSIVFFGGAPIIWLVKKYFEVKNALRNTVAGLRDAMDDQEVYSKVAPKLAAKQDKKDKRMVDKIKSELH